MKKIYEIKLVNIDKPVAYFVTNNEEEAYLLADKLGYHADYISVDVISLTDLRLRRTTYKMELNRLAKLLERAINAEMEVLNV